MRTLLFLMFFVLLTAETLGFDLSLAPGLSVKNAILYLVFIGIAIDAALNRNRDFEAASVGIPYALCIGYALFTWLFILLIIDYPGYSALGSLVALKGGLADHLIIFLVFFYGTLKASNVRWLVKALIWVVMLVNLVSVMDALNLPDLGLIAESEDGRLGGPIGESNQYAVFVSLFLPGAVALVFMERGWIRAIAVLGASALALALVLTASRGGTLGLVAGSALACVFLRRFIPIRVLLFGLGGALLVVFLTTFVAYFAGYGELLYERFVGTSVGSTHDISSGRTQIWTRALVKMFEQPLTLVTGYGWDSYSSFRDFGLAPHNSYLGIFFELGIIGLMLVLIAYGNVLRIARSALWHADAGSFLLLVGFNFGFLAVLVGVFFVELFAPWIFIWAYAGISVRLALTAIQDGAHTSQKDSHAASKLSATEKSAEDIERERRVAQDTGLPRSSNHRFSR